MKKTVYGQFVAGEDLSAIQPKIRHLRDSGVRSILDYAVEEDLGKEQEVVMEVRRTIPETDPKHLEEDLKVSSDPRFKPSKVKGSKPTRESTARTHFYAGEERCEENVKHFMSCIEMASSANQPNLQKDAFAAIKLTGLGRVEFLVILS
jgi:proline dehydrogenase